MLNLFIFIIPFLIVYLATPNIRYIALRSSVIDRKNSRKIHKKLITKLGGMGIYCGLLGGLIIVGVFQNDFFSSHSIQFLGLTICASLMLLLGIYDDFLGSNARTKFIVQIIISLLAINAGFRLQRFTIPNVIDLPLGNADIVVTVLWLVGITNAINLIDGLDGLAASVVSVASFFFCLYGLILGEHLVTYIALSLLGANLAFLRYNFYPAKIFMGDTGSLFLGFVLGCLAIYQTPDKHQHNILFFPATVLLLIPILDAVCAIIRRILRKQPIFSSDSSHIHHYYIKLGYSQTETVKRFCIMTFCLGSVAFLLIYYYTVLP